MRAAVLTEKQWKDIREQLKKDYPPSVWLSREKMRNVLGFTDREHTDWLGYYDTASIEDRLLGKHGYKTTIRLDFYDESKRTMFLLKYGDFLDDRKD